MSKHESQDQITPFDFQGNSVRVISTDPDAPLWVASDVAKALGYRMASDMTRRLDKDEKGTHIVRTSQVDGVTEARRMVLINESGLYSAILGSRVPEAKEFKRWVTHEVLPSIRKHGGYLTPSKLEDVLLNPDTLIQLAQNLKAEQEKSKALAAKIERDRPKTVFADAVATSHSTILVGDLAKILRGNGVDIGANRLFVWLREHKFLISRRGQDWNMPTQRSMDLGLFQIKETAVTHADGHVTVSKTPKVTGKGQRYFIDKFLNARCYDEQLMICE